MLLYHLSNLVANWMNEIESGDFMWIEFETMECGGSIANLMLLCCLNFFEWLMCYHVMLLKLYSSTSLTHPFIL